MGGKTLGIARKQKDGDDPFLDGEPAVVHSGSGYDAGGLPDLLNPLYGCGLIGKGVEQFEQGHGLGVYLHSTHIYQPHTKRIR